MRVAALFIFLFSFAVNAFPQFYVFDSIPDNLKNNASAVIRSEECLYTVTKPGIAEVRVKTVVTILNERGDRYRLLEIPYDKYSRVGKISGLVYNEKGQVTDAIGPSDVIDMSAASSGTFYSDDRMKVVYFPENKYPYTIEYEYNISYSSLISYYDWEFQDSPDVSVEKSGIQYVLPENMHLRFYEEDLKNKVDSVITDGKKIYTWQEENIPAFNQEETDFRRFYPTPKLYTAPLDFEYGGYKGSMRSWKEFGTWLYTINQGRDKLPDEEVSKIRELTSRYESRSEKVQRVYEYMQSRTRYLSVQIGIGGYRTAEAAEVSGSGYGDCKALVNYTHSLLKAIGIDSYFALIRAELFSDINPEFVDNSFDHVILCVPDGNDTIWLECTDQRRPFNLLSLSTSAKRVLLLTPQGGILARTPKLDQRDNKNIRSGLLYLTLQGSINGYLTEKYYGVNFGIASNKYDLQSEDELKRSLYESLRFYDLSVISPRYSEERKGNPEGILEYQISVRDFASVSGDGIYFCPAISIGKYLPDLKMHMKVPATVRNNDSISYLIPAGYIAEFMPPAENIQSEFGEFRRTIEVKTGNIVFKRTFILYEADIPEDKYDSFRTFIDSVARADRQKIVIAKSVSGTE